MSNNNNILDKLNNALSPTSATAMPDPEQMIQLGLDILRNSEIGARLVTLVDQGQCSIQVIETPEETTYIPEKDKINIGVRKNPPTTPGRFVLLLAGALREIEQENSGKKHPELHEPIVKHLSVSVSKQSDKVAHMCAVAYELNELLDFTEYNFFDELGKLGYAENINTFLREVRKVEG